MNTLRTWPFDLDSTFKLRTVRGWVRTPEIIQECCCPWSDAVVCCESVSESQNYKAANPCIGQAYKVDSVSKSGLMCWTDGMESAAVRVGVCSQRVLEVRSWERPRMTRSINVCVNSPVRVISLIYCSHCSNCFIEAEIPSFFLNFAARRER